DEKGKISNTINTNRNNKGYILSLVVFFLVINDLQGQVSDKLLTQISRLVDKEYAGVEKLYKHLHAYPELSFQEKETSKLMAEQLHELGFEVTENVGGYGVVGVLKNGKGPTILVRADMDALPIKEETNLPYASKIMTTDINGNEVPVMHACGHDLHMAVWA